MVKKIKSNELKPGMYVSDVNAGWFKHPFMTNSLKLEDEQMVQTIISHGIAEVFIDTDKGLDVGEHAPTIKEVRDKIQHDIDKVIEFKEKVEIVRKVPIHEELAKARKIKKETIQAVKRVMEDVMSGKEIEKGPVEEVVDNIIDSVIRNQDALVGLGRLRKVDEYTYTHSMGVCVLMVSFGRYLGFDSLLLREVGLGALMHDIGKTKVPFEILNKNGTLSEEEYEIIKNHATYSRDLLSETSGISETAIITAYEHHERIDGTGYPQGLTGDKISEYGRAIAIADVYDAITSDRCYQRKIQPTKALRMLYEWSEFHYDSDLVQKFIRCVGVYPVGTLVRMESGLLGVVVNHGEKSMLQPVVRMVFNIKKDSYITFPYDVDLSEPLSKGGADRIVGYEDPDKVNIQPEAYL